MEAKYLAFRFSDGKNTPCASNLRFGEPGFLGSYFSWLSLLEYFGVVKPFQITTFL